MNPINQDEINAILWRACDTLCIKVRRTSEVRRTSR